MRTLIEREHAVPICLFPPSTRAAAQFVFVDACGVCNRGISSDEEDLRNFCSMAGEATPEAKELFFGPVVRSIHRQPQGRGVLSRICEKMHKDDELNRYRISANEGTFRALRKIVRGLMNAHFSEVIRDDRVEVKACPYTIPEEIAVKEKDMHVIHSAIFRYWMVPALPKDGHWFWYLSILRTRDFVALVYP
jgi:hypothetical protein